MEKVELSNYEIVTLWALSQQEARNLRDTLYNRHILRKDGEIRKNKKYLSEYETGALEELRVLESLEKRFFDLIPSEEPIDE